MTSLFDNPIQLFPLRPRQETAIEGIRQAVREIPLTRGQVAIVDADDYENLIQWKWFAHFSRHGKRFYAHRNATVGGRRTTITMHRQLLGLANGDKREVDHANQNSLDNRKENLRVTDRSGNCCNRRRMRHNTSGYKGVTASRGKWMARIKKNKKEIFLGYFSTPEEAYSAYCVAADAHHGEFARLS